MISRREFLEAGGLALAGLTLAPRAWILGSEQDEIVIRLRSDPTGARVWFDPVGALVRPGQTVRWVLEEGVHSTTAYHPDHGDRAHRIPAQARPWDSGMLVEPGASFTHVPTVEGIYDYFCLPHEAAGMVGRLVVLRSGHPAPSARGLPDRGPRGKPVPALALAAFPSVTAILREGRVRP